jgi:hypothetical protein
MRTSVLTTRSGLNKKVIGNNYRPLFVPKFFVGCFSPRTTSEAMPSWHSPEIIRGEET